jgi:LysM repeat protein
MNEDTIDRKKAIMIAVVVNSALLVLICIGALTMQNSTSDTNADNRTLHSPGQVAHLQTPFESFPEGSSFSESVASKEKEPLEFPLIPSFAAEEPIAHKLPPIVQEAKTVPLLASPVAQPSFIEVVVQRGDSLEKIAKKHGTTVQEIVSFNHLNHTALKIGQVVKISTEKKVKPANKAQPLPPSLESSEYYIIKVGDNPWTIAMKHHIKVDELLKLNQLNEEKARKLKPGDRLRIK